MADGPTPRIGAKGNQHLLGEVVWLVREQRGSGERKFYPSNLADDATFEQLAVTIKARWICEQAHQQMRWEFDLEHLEGRSWTRLHRHALMAYAFYTPGTSTQRSGKKKRLPDPRIAHHARVRGLVEVRSVRLILRFGN